MEPARYDYSVRSAKRHGARSQPALHVRSSSSGEPDGRHARDAGWSLFNPYEAGWGISMVSGLSGHDGMCRPWSYHAFVFLDGVFAGTLAPVPSLSRTDGALTRDARIESDGRLGALFIRYAAEDPLCCPSRPSNAVSYHVERTPQGPVLFVDKIIEIPRM